ncbi:protein zer-1 homolog [Mercenaria mercenaria]|uniref:protein zer-1 homolog n=1 Tax=Mercenaria mercenaria TaxID=6596 RepID=UPI00234E52D1|nr:protein zer-1 homolog [Mercenaria mercenaria]
MAQAGSNEHPDGRLVKDCPDSLQDLCIFYCMNNLDILVASLNNISESKDDISSTFSLLLGNRLLEYYLCSCLPSEDKEQFVDQLMQNSQLCNEVNISRREVFNPDNVQELANNAIRRLQVTVFDEDSTTGTLEAYRDLLENNLSRLTSLGLYQKCGEESMTGLLNLLCGRDYDDDVDDFSDSDDESSNKNQGAGDNSDMFEGTSVVFNTKYHGFQIRNLDAQNEARTETGTGADESSISANQVVSNLKSFSYEQVYTAIDPHRSPSHSYGWFYHLLSKILLGSKQIQSFSLVTVISNPVEWFLSQPKLPLLKNLQSLCLSYEDNHVAALSVELDIPYTKKFFSNLPVLENLRHLDISCNNPGYRPTDRYSYDDSMVQLFIQSVKMMPQLKSLDISGSNLSTIIGHKSTSEAECKEHCMPGFEGRQFDYLGLYGNEEACRHRFIPARKVSGDATLDQLLVALWSLQHNKAIMLGVLKDLQDWIQAHYVTGKHGLPMLDGLVAYMTKIGDWDGTYSEAEYYEEKSISVILHCVYFLLRNDEVRKNITIKQKRQIAEQLFVICHTLGVHPGWQSSNQEQRNKIVRISMLLMLILDLETIAVNSYRFEQYIQVLLEVFHSPVRQTQQLLSLRLLHSACRISQEYKAIAGGKMQLVKKLMMIVLEKVTKLEDIDDIMEKVWSIIWTLTDEVPSNCELFVQHAGCHIAKTCIEKYPDAKSLHRKITGAMNNVSENASLLQYLMTTELVVMFRGMLSYHEEEDYDVSSHAAGFLVMLASHGPEAWTVMEPYRDEILEEVDQVMKKWDINKPKGVKFRSLSPMLSQLGNYSTPVAQLWGAWLICNLVIVKPQSYCDMLESEDGLTKINSVLQQGGLREEFVTLLEKIKSLTMDFKEGRGRNEQIDEDDD